MKMESELKSEVNDILNCYICLGKITNPKMCNYCKKLACSNCIDTWIKGGNNKCGFCKHKVNFNDFISVSFMNVFAKCFQNSNIIDPNLIQDNQNGIKDENKKVNNLEDGFHNCHNHVHNNAEHYCIKCDKYYCSNCIIYGDELGKHSRHGLIPISVLNKYDLENEIKELKNLPDAKNKLEQIELKYRTVLNIIDTKEKDFKTVLETATNLLEKQLKKEKDELKIKRDLLKDQITKVNNLIGNSYDTLSNYVAKNEAMEIKNYLQKIKTFNDTQKFDFNLNDYLNFGVQNSYNINDINNINNISNINLIKQNNEKITKSLNSTIDIINFETEIKKIELDFDNFNGDDISLEIINQNEKSFLDKKLFDEGIKVMLSLDKDSLVFNTVIGSRKIKDRKFIRFSPKLILIVNGNLLSTKMEQNLFQDNFLLSTHTISKKDIEKLLIKNKNQENNIYIKLFEYEVYLSF